jgi:hypothetical protein
MAAMSALSPAAAPIFERPTSLRESIRASAAVRFLDLPVRTCLMIDGRGQPEGSAAFAAAMGALFPVAYTLHFALKRSGRDEPIGPLEGLWWLRPGEGADPASR